MKCYLRETTFYLHIFNNINSIKSEFTRESTTRNERGRANWSVDAGEHVRASRLETERLSPFCYACKAKGCRVRYVEGGRRERRSVEGLRLDRILWPRGMGLPQSHPRQLQVCIEVHACTRVRTSIFHAGGWTDIYCKSDRLARTEFIDRRFPGPLKPATHARG